MNHGDESGEKRWITEEFKEIREEGNECHGAIIGEHARWEWAEGRSLWIALSSFSNVGGLVLWRNEHWRNEHWRNEH